jgi:glutamate synthase (NADPH/NADH) large chain
MTGGMAFIYDPENRFEDRANTETLFILPLSQDYWQNHLKSILAEHVKATDSALARQLLTDWEVEKTNFKQVVPKETINTLAHPVAPENPESRSA